VGETKKIHIVAVAERDNVVIVRRRR